MIKLSVAHLGQGGGVQWVRLNAPFLPQIHPESPGNGISDVPDFTIFRDIQLWPKLLGRSALPPSPPVQCWGVKLSVWWGGPSLYGGGGGIMSSSYMNSSVWEWSTEFVVSILSMIVYYEAAFQLILARIVACHIFGAHKFEPLFTKSWIRTRLWKNSFTIL